jgi:hypothetical protein
MSQRTPLKLRDTPELREYRTQSGRHTSCNSLATIVVIAKAKESNQPS